MKLSAIRDLAGRFFQLGVAPGDSQDIRSQKSLLVLGSLMCSSPPERCGSEALDAVHLLWGSSSVGSRQWQERTALQCSG
jgi:hypothetical protein